VNKKRGYAFERYVKEYLKSMGFWVARQAASRHPDLIAIVPGTGQVILVECKAHLPDFNDREKLWNLAEELNVAAYIAWWDKENKRLQFMEVRRVEGVSL